MSPGQAGDSKPEPGDAMRQRVLAALRHMQENSSEAITVRSVARTAGVYRSFILRHPELLSEIRSNLSDMREEDKRTVLMWFRVSPRVADLIVEMQGDGTASQFIWEAVLEKLASAKGVSVKDIDPAKRVPMSPNRRKRNEEGTQS